MTPVRSDLLAALGPYVVRRRLLAAAVGLLQGLAVGAIIAAGALLLMGREVLQSPAALLLLPVALLPALARIVSPLRPLDAALAVERAFPFLQDTVATAVDLLTRDPGRAPRSEAAVVRVAREATCALNDLPIARAAPVRMLRTPAVTACLALGLAMLAWAAAPSAPTPAVEAPALTSAEDAEPIVTQPPSIFDLSLVIDPPAYCNQPRRTTTSGIDAVRAPLGSSITISATAIPESAQAIFTAEPGGDAEMAAQPDGRRVHSFTLASPLRWRLTSRDAGATTATPWRALEPVEDQPPLVRLVRPESDLSLLMAAPVEVAIAASDDYGISTLGLRHRLGEDEQWRSLPLEFAPGAIASANARLNPAALGLKPGGELLLCAYATDNDAFSGRKTSVSAPIRITLGAAADFEQAAPETPLEQAQSEEADALEELQRTAEALQRELTEALRGIASGEAGGADEEATPTRPGFELQEAARRLQEQAGRLEQAMRRAEEQLAESGLMTPELVEKVRELHELMRDVMDEELRKALDELQRTMEAQSPEEMRMSLERAQEAQERFMQRLEQTLSLLRRARLEALLGQLRQEAERLLARQQQLSEETAKLPDGRSDESRRTGNEQRALARDTEPLSERVEAGVEQAREVDAEVAARLGAIADRLQREDPAAQMRRATGAIERGQPSDAGESQQQASRSLEGAAADLRELEEQFRSDFSAEARKRLAEMLRDTLVISQGEEDVTRSVAELRGRSRNDLLLDKRPTAPLRRRQTTLTTAASRLAERMHELAGQAPVINPMLPAAARVIADEMGQIAREIEGADIITAHDRGRNVMRGLNELAQLLLEADEQLSQQSAQSALQQYMEQLKSLSQRQQALNEEAAGSEQGGRQPGQMPGMSPSQMAFEQALIRRALEEMMSRGGEATGSMTDQLGGVPGEMEKVEGDLRSGRLQRETIERQGRILEKMLEAQRSLYTKERESPERKAERPTVFEPPPSPPALSPSLTRSRGIEVQRGRGADRLPRGWEDLVREYYRALGRER